MTREEFKKACEAAAIAHNWDRRVMFYEFDTVIEAWFYKDGRDVAQGFLADGDDPVGIPPLL